MNKRINRLKRDLIDQIGTHDVHVIDSGKPLDDSWYPEYLNVARTLGVEELDRLMSLFEISNRMAIALNIYNDNELKAFSEKDGSRYSINISEGISKHAYVTALGFLSNNMFSHILKEEEYMKRGGNIAVRFLIDIMLISFHFTLVHEFLHISLGHLDYLSDKYGLNILYENKSNHTPNNLLQQALEMQCDISAAGRIVETNKYYDFVFGIGVAVFFDIFNYERLDINDYKGTTHPHPLVRLIGLYSAYDKDDDEAIYRAEQFQKGSFLALKSFEYYNDGLLFDSLNASELTPEQQFEKAATETNRIGAIATDLFQKIPPMSPAVIRDIDILKQTDDCL